MSTKTVSISEDSLVNLLKTLSEEKLVNIFWKTLVISDASPLSEEERMAIELAKREFARGETVRWEDLK